MRQILLDVEALGLGQRTIYAVETKDDQPVVYNVGLLLQGGYLEGMTIGGVGTSVGYIVRSLTWEGHDLLDSIRDQGVWRETKEKLRKVGGNVSIAVMMEVAKDVARGFLLGGD